MILHHRRAPQTSTPTGAPHGAGETPHRCPVPVRCVSFAAVVVTRRSAVAGGDGRHGGGAMVTVAVVTSTTVRVLLTDEAFHIAICGKLGQDGGVAEDASVE